MLVAKLSCDSCDQLFEDMYACNKHKVSKKFTVFLKVISQKQKPPTPHIEIILKGVGGG